MCIFSPTIRSAKGTLSFKADGAGTFVPMSGPRPVFDRRIFWDVDHDRMDLDAKWSFVIERVFERGDVEDIRQCRRYYGDERVREALLNAKFLPEQTMYFASAVVGEPLEKFRCYTLRRSRQGHYPY